MAKKNKTITLNAQVAVSKTETGMDYVQVMPDNPRVGLVEPFHGMGYGQMLNKRTLVLQELGGKYEPTYVVSVLGSLATLEFQEGDLVIATLRFSSREYNGQMFMDVVATELIKK